MKSEEKNDFPVTFEQCQFATVHITSKNGLPHIQAIFLLPHSPALSRTEELFSVKWWKVYEAVHQYAMRRHDCGVMSSVELSPWALLPLLLVHREHYLWCRWGLVAKSSISFYFFVVFLVGKLCTWYQYSIFPLFFWCLVTPPAVIENWNACFVAHLILYSNWTWNYLQNVQ